MLELQTNKLKTRKHVLIDGVEFTVKRPGNMDTLNLSQMTRRLNDIAKLEKAGELDKDTTKEGEDIAVKINDIFLGLFDDGGDQSNTKKIILPLSYEELTIVMEQIFKEEVKDDAETKEES